MEQVDDLFSTGDCTLMQPLPRTTLEEVLFADMIDGLRASGAYVHPGLRLKTSEPRGVVMTSTTTEDNTRIFTIANKLGLSLERVSQTPLRSWLADDGLTGGLTEPIDEMAVLVLYERRLRRQSHWYHTLELGPTIEHFVRTIPHASDPAEWAKGIAEWYPIGFNALVETHAAYGRVHDFVRGMQLTTPIKCMEDVTREEVVWARCMCSTRMFAGPVLIPAMDMLNHAANAKSLIVDNTESSVDAAHPLPYPNQEMYVNYGSMDAVTSLTTYGFTTSDTENTVMVTPIVLNIDSAKSGTQGQLLCNHFPRLTDAHGAPVTHDTKQLLLDGHTHNLLCNPAPSDSLMVALRICALRTLRDMDMASTHDFARPLSLQNEVSALRMLYGFLADAGAQIQVDDTTLDQFLCADTDAPPMAKRWAAVVRTRRVAVRAAVRWVHVRAQQLLTTSDPLPLV